MQHVRANTETLVVIGPFVDVTDGYTPETGIDLSTADEAEILKHNTATVSDISAATWAAVTGADGYYVLTLTAALTDTEGRITVIVNDDSVCLPVRNDFMVLSEAAYDSLYVAKDDGYMDVNLKALSEDTTAADILELFVEALKADTGQIDDGTFAANAINAAAIADAAIDNATFAADVGSTAYASNIIALAVRKVLDELRLDHLLAVADNDDVVDNSVIAKLATTYGDWSNYSAASDSLETQANLLASVELAVGSTGVKVVSGSVREAVGLASANLDTQLAACVTATGFSTHSAADVVTALGTGSTLTACVTATGFSTHSAADVVTAIGTGSTLTALATAASITTIDTLLDKMAPAVIGTIANAGEGTETYVYGGVTATYTVDADGNRTAVEFS